MKTVWLPGSLEASEGTLGGSCRHALRTAVSEYLPRTGRMAQCVEAPPAQLNNQSSAPGTHGRRELTQASWPLTSGTHAHKIKELKKESLSVLPSSKKLTEAFIFFFLATAEIHPFWNLRGLIFFKFVFMYVREHFAYICVCALCVPSAHRG